MIRVAAILTLLAGLFTTDGAWAQALQNVVLQNSFSPVGTGARGLGMGGAFVAVADDGTAASFNPAGLSQLRKTEFAAVGFWDQLNSTITAAGQSTESRNRHGALDFLGLSLPFAVGDRNLTVNFSYQRSVDLFGKGTATLVDTFPLTDFVPSGKGSLSFVDVVHPNQSGAFNTASIGAGYQLTPHLSFGATATYWFAHWTARGSIDERLVLRLADQPQPIVEPVKAGTFSQDQKMGGINFTAGFLLRHTKVSLGGVVRFPFAGDYTLQEADHRVLLSGTELTVEPFDSRVTTQLHWPLTLGGGIALRPFHNLTLAGDFSSTHWSRMFISDLPDGALLTAFQRDPSGKIVDNFVTRNFFDLIPQAHTSTVNTNQWRAGGEYLIVASRVVIPLRGGYLLDRSPITDLGRDDGRRIRGWTVGFGVNFSHLVLDFALERRTSEGLVGLRLEANQPIHANLPTESVSEYRTVASFIYRFGDNDPLKRAFRHLFGEGEAGSN
jgi:hypothetical protein